MKKCFSLIELLLVILIIGILLSASSRFFRPESKNKFYLQTCINKVFGEVRTFSNNAIFGKGISYSGSFYFPNTYNIIFDKFNNKIDLEIEVNDLKIKTKTIYLSGSKRIKECQNKGYNVFFSGSVDMVKIQKNLEEKGNIKGFTIIPKQFTGNIDFYVNEYGIHKKISIFQIDQRTQTINNKKCLSLPSDIKKECLLRSE